MIKYEYRLSWYYDCPVIASYMKKTFDFSFWDENGATVCPYESDPTSIEKFYVNGFSMEELNPEVGDIVLQTSVEDKNWFVLGYWEDVSCRHQEKRYSTKIIQRNGKPFFMPYL